MSHYDDVLRCERQRLAPKEETDITPCEFCGSTNYDYLLKGQDGDIVGCDDCVTKVYR